MKEVFVHATLTYVVPIIIGLFFTGLAALITWAAKMLKTKFEADGKVTLIEGAVLKVAHFADAVVRDVEAGTKKSIEAARADGKLDANDYKAIKDEALEKLKASLGERGLTTLRGALDLPPEAVDTYLSGAVERAVTTVSAQKAVKEAAADAPFAKLPGGLPPVP